MRMIISFIITFVIALMGGATFLGSLGAGVLIGVISFFVGGKSDSDYLGAGIAYPPSYNGPPYNQGSTLTVSERQYSFRTHDSRVSDLDDYRERKRGKKHHKHHKHHRNSEAQRSIQWSNDFYNSRRYVPRGD